jgi:hypothetical protein
VQGIFVDSDLIGQLAIEVEFYWLSRVGTRPEVRRWAKQHLTRGVENLRAKHLAIHWGYMTMPTCVISNIVANHLFQVHRDADHNHGE